jgi:hypothetical protein
MQQDRYKWQQYRRQLGDGFNRGRLDQRYDARQPDGYDRQRPTNWRGGFDQHWQPGHNGCIGPRRRSDVDNSRNNHGHDANGSALSFSSSVFARLSWPLLRPLLAFCVEKL